MASPARSLKLDPITGEEDLRDLTHPRHALSQFYRAFNSQDLPMLEENWSCAEDVSMSEPIAGVTRGWPEIRRAYERIFSGPARLSLELHNYSLRISGDLFYAEGRELARHTGPGMNFETFLRVTRIFRHDSHHWRQVHCHGSIDEARQLARYVQILDAAPSPELCKPPSKSPLIFTPPNASAI
jgi:ketosteroid isomerase-like protein